VFCLARRIRAPARIHETRWLCGGATAVTELSAR
jgi:hypothetical protein